ncbi:MAG: hypothetical protein Q9225_005925 [Loekoesia sp. 1 TL-2023]
METGVPPKRWGKTPNWLEQDPECHLSAIESSPFGQLPVEVRLHIYNFLVEPCTIHVWRHKNRLSNSLCPESSNDPRSFGPVGTLKELVASNNLNQDAVVTEATCSHIGCAVTRVYAPRPRISFSLFLTCRLFYAEGKDIVNKIYLTSTFHFRNIPALELFVDTISPAHKALLRQIHLTLPVARYYGGVHHPLNQTLNRLAPNPYANGSSPGHIPKQSPHLRLRIQFHQYSTDHGFEVNLSPSIHRLISRLPAYLFSSVLVIVPALPAIPVRLPFVPGQHPVTVMAAPKWYTKLVPSHNLECLCEIVTEVMEARYTIRQAERQGRVRVDQWMCCDEARGQGEGWWTARRKDLEIKWAVVFGV